MIAEFQSFILICINCVFSVTSTVSQEYMIINDKEEEDGYKNYLLLYNKSISRIKNKNRINIFHNNKKYVTKHNNDDDHHSYSLRINQFSDLSDDELVSHVFPYNMFNNQQEQQQEEEEEFLSSDITSFVHRKLAMLFTSQTPSSINWADPTGNPTHSSVVSPVGNQGMCGACWAFTAVYATEASVRLAGESVSLSVQELVDCDRNNTAGVNLPPRAANNGCSGGNPIRAFR